MNRKRFYQSVFVALLGAVGYVLMVLEFPLLPSFPFLKFDFGDVPALIAGIYFGPLSAVAVELIKNAIHILETSSMGYGEIMNFIVGCAFVVPFSIVFRNAKTNSSAIKILFSSIISIISIVIIGVLGNAVITPLYYKHILKLQIDNLYEIIIFGIVPFNALKGLILSILSYPLITTFEKSFKKMFNENGTKKVS